MNPIYVIRERELGAFWCPINGKWNWTDNVRAAKTFSSNEEAAAEFRRVKLDAFGYMVSIISVCLDYLVTLLRKIARSGKTRSAIQT